MMKKPSEQIIDSILTEQELTVCYDERDMAEALFKEVSMHFPELKTDDVVHLVDCMLMRLRRDCPAKQARNSRRYVV